MATVNDLKTNLKQQQVKAKDPQKDGMNMMLKRMSEEIKKALPAHVSSDRFQRVVLTAFNSNANLQKCDPVSFLAAMMQSAQLGVEPNTPLGQAYLIPYGNKVQFQLSYKGMLDLAQRSGQFQTIYAHKVHANDEFNVEYGLEQDLKHKPNFNDRGEVIGYYAVYKLLNGGSSFLFMTKHEILHHAEAKSKTFRNGPWQTDFDAMALKTVIKQLLKYAPLSVEVAKAISADESVKKEISEDMDLVKDEALEVEFEIVEENETESETE